MQASECVEEVKGGERGRESAYQQTGVMEDRTLSVSLCVSTMPVSLLHLPPSSLLSPSPVPGAKKRKGQPVNFSDGLPGQSQGKHLRESATHLPLSVSHTACILSLCLTLRAYCLCVSHCVHIVSLSHTVCILSLCF